MPEFEYKGKTIEELKKMELEEFMKLLKSRGRRSLKRGFTENQKKLLKKIEKNPKKFHRIKSRDLVIIPSMVGIKLGVYNGKEYVSLEIKPEMIGHRIGEFVLTRRQVKHSSPGFGATRSSKFIPLK